MSCNKCGRSGAKHYECSIQETWLEMELCDDCVPILTNALLPLMQLGQIVDTSKAATYGGRVTRMSIRAGSVKDVGSNPKNPLHMGLRVIDGMPDLKGRVVDADFTHDEINKILAFLISRPDWAQVALAMLAERSGFPDDADLKDNKTIRQRLVNVGRNALSIFWTARNEKAS